MRIDHHTRTIWLRQSGLETFLLCPERARRQWFEGEVEETNDAAATGTAIHAAIEENLGQRRDHGVSIPTVMMVELAKREYDDLHETGIKYVKGTYDDAMTFIETGIPAWRAYIEPNVAVDESLKLEWEFDVPLMKWAPDYKEERGEPVTWMWDVRLTGTSDCVDRFRIYDWKHSGQWYKQWEKQRYSIQATVYAHAAVHEGLHEWPVDFSFAAIKKLKTKEFAELVPIKRYVGHVDWLCRQVDALLTLWDSVGEQGPWPLVDTHALCSEKWCPFWSTCKGAEVPTQHFLWKPN